MLICCHCNKECKSAKSLTGHRRLCSLNPLKAESNLRFHTGIPWNKGHTKENDPRVLKNAESLSKTKKGKPSTLVWTAEMRLAKSLWRKQLHIDHPETHPNRRLAGNRRKMTYPERVAFDWLTANNIVFEHNAKVDRYYPDFKIGRLLIEIDGEYWHESNKDEIRDKHLTSLGFSVIRIRTKENIEERLKKIFEK